MNESSINTRCPACHTDFNVTAGQRKVADGLVRCGSCLHVFNARQHCTLTPSAQKQSAEAKSEEITTEASSTASTPTSTPLKPEASVPEPSKPKPSKPKPILQQAVLLSIPESQFELDEDITVDRPVSRYLAYVSIVVLILLCAAQILWFQQQQWLDKDLVRPIYQAFYTLTDQPLPTKKSPDLIISKQFIIQPHEEFADAIRISILLENSADFVQPFPSLQLLFTDLKGRTVAQRTLPSNEYINTTLFPNQMMPSKQPVQIQVDMITPGHRAVGYQLNLIPG